MYEDTDPGDRRSLSRLVVLDRLINLELIFPWQKKKEEKLAAKINNSWIINNWDLSTTEELKNFIQ